MTTATEARPTEAPYTEETRQVLERAQRGDRTVLPQLRELLDGRPALWQEFGDLARHVREALLSQAAGQSLLALESIRRRMEEMRGELTGPAASPLEKLLLERVLVCWADAHIADLCAIQKDRAGGPPDAHAVRRQTAAQARYLAAVKQLALVGKLLKPAPTPLQLLRVPVDETAGRRADGAAGRVGGGRTRADALRAAAATNG